MCVYIYLYVCMYVCMYVCVCVYIALVCVCVYGVCVCVCVCVYCALLDVSIYIIYTLSIVWFVCVRAKVIIILCHFFFYLLTSRFCPLCMNGWTYGCLQPLRRIPHQHRPPHPLADTNDHAPYCFTHHFLQQMQHGRLWSASSVCWLLSSYGSRRRHPLETC